MVMGVNLTGVQTALKSNAGLNYNSNELEIKFDTLGTPAGGIDGSADKILIYDNNVGALKQVSPNNIAGLFNAAVTTYGGDNSGRVIVANGTGDIQGQANLTFSANKLTITGDLSGSGFVSASVGHFVTRVEAGAISLGDATGLAGAGLTNASGQLDIQVSGALKLASDKVGITGSLAGYGITYNGGIDSISSLKLDLGSLTDAAISRTNDFIPFIDADDGEAKRESVTDVVGFIAGAGLDASSGQLSVDVSDFLANGSDNRIITSVNADSMNAEANMTFTGDFLNINGSGSIDRLGINEDPDSNNRLIISGSNTDYLLQIKQQGNGYPTLFLGGENHASYAGVFYNRGTFVNAGAISQGNLPGDNGSHTRLVVRKTSISDNTATDIVTITVPNANHAAAIRVFGLANFDGCTYSQAFSFQGTIARASGTPTDKGFSSVTTTENASITPNFSIAVGGSSNTGANSATQTFKLQFTINTSDNSSSNATIMIELINFNDSGITMAAS